MDMIVLAEMTHVDYFALAVVVASALLLIFILLSMNGDRRR
jgi:hypothetical protein